MKVMLIEPPVANLEAPGIVMPAATAALRAAGHEVVQWNAGAELLDKIAGADRLRRAAERARAAADELSALPNLNRLQAARLLILSDNLPLADVLIQHIDAFKRTLRGGGPSGPAAALPYDIIQAALDISMAPFYPEKIVLPQERFKYNAPNYICQYSHRSLADLMAAASNKNMFWDQVYSELAAPRATAENPDLVALILNETSQVVPGVKLAAHLCAALPAARVVLAGNWPTMAMADITDPAFFDIVHGVVTAPPEDALPLLCDHIAETIPLEQVPGCLFLNGDTVQTTPAQVGANLAGQPAPDFSDYNFHHLLSNRLQIELPFQITRGCEWRRCAFCVTDSSRVQPLATQPMDVVLSKLKTVMADTGCGAFRIVDPSLPAQEAKMFALSLIQNDVMATWQASVRPEPGFTPETCEILRAAGCLGLHVGVEALCDTTLQRIQKGLGASQIEQTIRNMAHMGLQVNAHLIFGLPGTTREELEETVNRLVQLIKEGLLANVAWTPFSLMKLSPIANEPAKYGITVNPSERLDASEMLPFQRTSGMNEQDLAAQWRLVQEQTGRALAQARMSRARPSGPPPQPTLEDEAFMAKRPLLVSCIRATPSHFSYQDLRAAAQLQWNALQQSFEEFERDIAAGQSLPRLPEPRRIVKNPLTNTNFELSGDYTMVLDQIQKGGAVGEILERLAAAGAGDKDALLKRMIAMRGHIIVFA